MSLHVDSKVKALPSAIYASIAGVGDEYLVACNGDSGWIVELPGGTAFFAHAIPVRMHQIGFEHAVE